MGEGEGGKSESLKRIRIFESLESYRLSNSAARPLQTALHALLWESWRVFLFLVSAIDYGYDRQPLSVIA